MHTTIDVSNEQPRGLSVREGFGSSETVALAEISSRAVAEQARAAVEARYVMAIKRPRNIDNVRVSLLRDCARPGFASTSRYSKPVGDGRAEGWTIRFAEAAMRTFGNIQAEAVTLYDDDDRRVVRVSVTDLEANVTHHKDLTLRKTVERRRVKKGQKVLSSRLNSSGEMVYTVEATEDDLAVKEAAQQSKALRVLSLRLIPADILEECLERVRKTIDAGDDAKDPDAVKKRVVDAFAAIGVTPDAIERFLGHPLSQLTKKDIADCNVAITTVREGESSWADILDARLAERAPASTPEPQAPGGAAEQLTAKLKAKQQSQQQPSNGATDGSLAPAPEVSQKPETPSSQTIPAPGSVTAEPPAGEEPPLTKLMNDEFDQHRQRLAAIKMAIEALLNDKKQAHVRWQTHVQSLRGLRTHDAWKTRIEQAEKLLEDTKVEIEFEGKKG